MKTRSLTEFVELALDKGLSKAKVHELLKGAGWGAGEVNKVIDLYSESDQGLAIPRPREIATAKQFFYYSLMFLAMYMAIYNIGVIGFNMIDLFFDLESISRAEGAIRWAASFSIIFLPMYILLLTKEESWAGVQSWSDASLPKRWLTYATMLVSAFVALLWLVFLLEDFLSGKLNMPVGLKTLTVITVASFVFYYLLGSVKSGDKKENSDE